MSGTYKEWILITDKLSKRTYENDLIFVMDINLTTNQVELSSIQYYYGAYISMLTDGKYP